MVKTTLVITSLGASCRSFLCSENLSLLFMFVIHLFISGFGIDEIHVLCNIQDSILPFTWPETNTLLITFLYQQCY